MNRSANWSGRWDGTVSVTLVAGAYAGLAIASSAAAWMLSRMLAELARDGGGIRTVSYWLWQSARVPLAAAWLAAGLTVLALAVTLFARRSGEAPPARNEASLWLAIVAIAAGASAVLLFRGTTSFLLDAITPGRQPAGLATSSELWAAVVMSVRVAGAASVACFLVAMALAFAIFRRHAVSSRLALIVLLVSLVASVALVADLRSFVDTWHGVSVGSPEHLADFHEQLLSVSDVCAAWLEVDNRR